MFKHGLLVRHHETAKEFSSYAVFRLEHATEVLELTYLLGKYFVCVNAN